MKKATIRLPPTTTRPAWVGAYGRHSGLVAVFSRMPEKRGPAYDSYANRDILAGLFNLRAFNQWFGTSLAATGTNIEAVEEYEITAPWDDHGRIMGLDAHYD